MLKIVVPAGEAAKKLENFLKKDFPIGYIRKLFRKNGIRLNGKRAKPDDPIHAADLVQLYIPFASQGAKPNQTAAQPDLEIVYEDDALLVINKPAGLAVHEGETVSKRESLAGWIERKYRDSKFRPQLVHRLDKDTSGLLVLAKNETALAELESQFEAGTIDKHYLCLVAGRLSAIEAKLDFPLPGRDANQVRALTRYRVVQRFAETTLVRVNIETGRRHQIRLHFAKLGHPVVLDEQHGDFNFNRKFRKAFGLKRQFLHAAQLNVSYAGKRHGWSAQLPKDLARTLKLLEDQE